MSIIQLVRKVCVFVGSHSCKVLAVNWPPCTHQCACFWRLQKSAQRKLPNKNNKSFKGTPPPDVPTPRNHPGENSVFAAVLLCPYFWEFGILWARQKTLHWKGFGTKTRFLGQTAANTILALWLRFFGCVRNSAIPPPQKKKPSVSPPALHQPHPHLPAPRAHATPCLNPHPSKGSPLNPSIVPKQYLNTTA